ncbi:GntR family transcriptional regulator [Paracoccus saliphilus]|uniref:GntR family transcriptional regulator n=1 Tax=Paracoccus saliphilus TaxID=405559 RepID=A0AA45W2K1_9RHOB|nr:GntR family transcriptional regulator [Paracoccus saliphilus]WCR01473.1 GntR family transcriptional regulator [Paracoccus saliphilus]SIS69014.1 transcriptional regulator, GntR family [Paracoccus saliphilus]
MDKKIVRLNLSAQLYESLRLALMNGQYEPGHRLTIAGLAEEYGTSITPVREAIFRLVSERALQMRAATSFQVPRFDTVQLLEIQAIRQELEGRAAYEAAARITPEELDELREIHARFIAAAARDPAKASILNRNFHFALLRMSGMPLLVGLCENMWTLIGPLLRLFHIRMPVREIASDEHKHHELLDALASGNQERSRKAIQEDIAWAEDLIREIGAELSDGSVLR